MLLTLAGRLQTRVFVLLTVGAVLTFLVTPLLPMDAPILEKYEDTFTILLAVTVLGLAWEVLYHLLQQFRWEKDWPTMLGLLTGVNEGVLLWLLLANGAVPGVPDIGWQAFVIDFAVVWIGTWLWVNGPMRVPFIRWRFRGGRLV
jgi:hypothetical protein